MAQTRAASAKERKPNRDKKSSEPSNPSTASKETPPYRHFIIGERPRADAAFFELLVSQVYLASGGKENFDGVWVRVIPALASFNVFRLAHLSGEEMRQAIVSTGGNFGRVMENRASELITWAESFWRIRQIYGSFRRYLGSFDAEGPDALIKDLNQRFTGLSAETLVEFLSASGVAVTPPRKENGKSATSGGSSRRRRGRSGRDANRRGRRGSDSRPKSSDQTKGQPAKEPAAAKAPSQKESRPKRKRRRIFRRKRSKSGNEPSP